VATSQILIAQKKEKKKKKTLNSEFSKIWKNENKA
jgi:hypothetical protein